MSGYTKDPNFHDAIFKIVPYIEKYYDPNDDTLEIEFRLGFVDDETYKFNSLINQINK